MNAWARRGLQAAVFTGFTGGVLALGAGIASASECCPDRPVSPLAANLATPVRICDNVVGTPVGPMAMPCVDEQLDTSELTGTSPVDLPTDATGLAGNTLLGNRGQANVVMPVEVTGNAVAIGSDAYAESSTSTSYQHDATVVTDSAGSPIGGNVVNGNWVAPVAVTGNAASLAGNAAANTDSQTSASSTGPVVTDGSTGPGAGNVIDVPLATPVQATGNAIGTAGTAQATGSHEIDAEAGGPVSTSGAHNLVSGNLGSGAAAVPVQVNDNGVAWVGEAFSAAESTADATAGGDLTTDGHQGIGAGNLVDPAVAGPASLSGNAVSWVGVAGTAGSATNSATAGGDATTNGDASILSGNMSMVDGAVPVQALGNGATWIGTADGNYADDTTSIAGGTNTTSGEHGIGSGDVGAVPAAGPVQLAGNAGSLIGSSLSGSQTTAETEAGGVTDTSGNHSVVGGFVTDTPVATPIQGFGNAVTGIGDATAWHDNEVDATAGGNDYTFGHNSILGGEMAAAPAAGQIDVFGNGIAGIGTASASAASDSEAEAGGFQGTGGDSSLGGGNLAQSPIALPMQLFGNGLSGIGEADGSALNTKTAEAGGPPNTNDDHGIGASNVLHTPVAGPAEIFGVAGSAIGIASATGESDTTARAGGPVEAVGTSGIGSGNVAGLPASVPMQVFGDAVSWIGFANGYGSASTTSKAGREVVTDGADGIGTGNVLFTPVSGVGQLFGDSVGWIAGSNATGLNDTYSNAGGDVQTAGTGGLVAGNVGHAPALGVVQGFGDAVGWIANTNADGASHTVSNAGGDVTTDGTGGVLSGDVAATPAGGLAQAFGDVVNLTGISYASGANMIDATSGGDVTTDGTNGFLSGVDPQLPVGVPAQLYGLTLGTGLAGADASNDTDFTVGNQPGTGLDLSGEGMPGLALDDTLDADQPLSVDQLPALPNVGSIPRMPELDELFGAADLAGLAELPELGELPELPADEFSGAELAEVQPEPAAVTAQSAHPQLPGTDGVNGLDFNIDQLVDQSRFDQELLRELYGFSLPMLDELVHGLGQAPNPVDPAPMPLPADGPQAKAGLPGPHQLGNAGEVTDLLGGSTGLLGGGTDLLGVAGDLLSLDLLGGLLGGSDPTPDPDVPPMPLPEPVTTPAAGHSAIGHGPADLTGVPDLTGLTELTELTELPELPELPGTDRLGTNLVGGLNVPDLTDLPRM